MNLLNKSPEMCERLAAANPSKEMLTTLLRRRSLTVKDMTGPGPNQDELDVILTIASRVPDHKKQVPWRFLTFQGENRQIAGKKLRTVFASNNPDTDPDLLDFEENRLTRAPVVIAVISTATPDNPKVPEWEQILTAGAVCQNVLLAVNALGYAGQWLSEWYAYDNDFLAHIGLSDEERIAGFIYIGTATKEPAERGRPDIKDLSQKWEG